MTCERRRSGRVEGTPVKKVALRAEVEGRDSRNLWAYLDDAGALVFEGQDLGPGTAPVSSDGEYEWTTTIRADHLPRLLELLGAPPGADILLVLQQDWSGPKAAELERLIRESELPVERWTWSG